MSVARTPQGFCPCGLQVEPGDHFTTRGGIAVHVGCEDRDPKPEGEPTFWTLTTAPDPEPKKPARTFAPLSLDSPTRSDAPRLVGQLRRTYDLMSDGQWWTLDNLAEATGCLPSTSSSRVRDLRKRQYGGHVVLRRLRRDGSGRREYKLVLNQTNGAAA